MGEKNRGIETWKEHTTAFDRVRSIAQGLSQPQTAGYIANEAAVSETTAHSHLKRLVDMNIIREITDTDAVRYEPDPLYTRFAMLRSLIDKHDHQELLKLKSDLQQQVEQFTEEQQRSSPAELRKYGAETDTSSETEQLLTAASEWDMALFHLEIVNDAIENYTLYTSLNGSALV